MKIFTKHLFIFCCIAICLLNSVGGSAQTITTYAGNGYGAGFYSLIGGYAGDGGFASFAELHNPNFVVYHAGSEYFADFSNECIRKIDANGIITTVAGNGTVGNSGDGGPATSAQMNGVTSLVFDAAGNMYIADHYNSLIHKVDLSGIITTVAGNGGGGSTGDGGPATDAQIGNPQYVAVDAAGNLYISDGNYAIRKVNAAGIISTVVGTGVNGFSGDGGPATAAKIAVPMQVAFDTAGNLYFADWGNWRIRKVDAAGIITSIAGNGITAASGDGGPATDAGLGDAISVTFDYAGNMYLATEWSNTIRRIDHITSIITTVAGTGSAGYSGDGGPATAAQLDGPGNCTFDTAGNMYIADFWNNVIRKVSFCDGVTAGTITNSGNTALCGNGSLSLSMLGATAPNPYILYQWKSSTDGINYTNAGTDTTFYNTGTLTTTTYIRGYATCSASGNSDSTTVDTITVYHNPPHSDTICLGNSLTLEGDSTELNWTVVSGGSPVNSLSCTNCPNPIVTPTQTTQYVQLSPIGCNDTTSILVLSAATKNFDTIICVNNAIQLSVPAATLSGIAPQIQWSPSLSLSSSTISNPVSNPQSNISYIVTVNYTSLCSVMDTVNVSVSNLSVPVAADTTICQGAINPVLQVQGDSLTWYTSSAMTNGTLQQPTITTEQTAFDTFYVANRCGEAPVSVQIKGMPTVKLGNDTSVCNDVVLQLTPQVENVEHYKWNTGDTTIAITATKSSEYRLEVSNSCAVAADSINIFIAPCSACLWAPNAFTPNGDGNDDLFHVIDKCGTVMGYHIEIVNRWGQMVYDSFDVSKGWDGTLNGQQQPTGTYYYQVTATYNLDGGKQVALKGDVTIIR